MATLYTNTVQQSSSTTDDRFSRPY